MKFDATLLNLTSYQLLRTIGKALVATHDSDAILEKIMEFIGDIFQPSNWSLLIADDIKRELYFAIVVGEASDVVRNITIPYGEGIAGWALQHGKNVLVEDTEKDPRFFGHFDDTSFRADSIIAIPLKTQDKVIGIFELINVDHDFFRKDYIELLESLADFAAIAIENAKYIKLIKERSIRDDCTDFYNARHMNDLFNVEISRSLRQKTSFSTVFIDLDNFKTINDTFGHMVGSQLLRKYADFLRDNIRPTDWPIRYGGDEFVLILPATDSQTAYMVIERIRQRLHQTIFFHDEGYNIKVTASIGIATFPDHADSKKKLIENADKAMYAAKEKGRDSVVIFSDEL